MPGKEDFSGFEVIRAAMEVEKQGRRFYSSMASKAPSEQTREVFALLAEDEITHLKTLEDMIPKYQDAAYWENEEQFVPYLRQFSSEQVFPSAEQVEAVVASDQAEIQSLELALVAEEKFAAYFRRASEHSRTLDGKEAFAWLAGEEERHAQVIKARRDKLLK